MGQSLKARAIQSVQQAGRLFGLEIRRNAPPARDDLRLAQFLRAQQVDLIFDVGANLGQFAEQMFGLGFAGRIVSFEAMPDEWAQLAARAATHPRWVAAPQAAVGDRAGEVEFHINLDGPTSSILPTSDFSNAVNPGSKLAQTLSVPMVTLDAISSDYLTGVARPFLKIDVQGAEDKVLAGADKLMDTLVGMVVEISFTELYQDQPLAFEVLQPLLDRGFDVHDIAVAYRDPSSHRLLCVDAVLFHRNRLADRSVPVTTASGG